MDEETEFESDMIAGFVTTDLNKVASKLLSDIVPSATQDYHKSRRMLQLMSRANVASIPEYFWGIHAHRETSNIVDNATSITDLGKSEDYYGTVLRALKEIAYKQPIDKGFFQLSEVNIPFPLGIESLLRCFMLLTLLKGVAKVDRIAI